jgi:predicted phage tail component-like protein
MDYFKFNNVKSTDKDIVLIDYKPIFLPANDRRFVQIPGRDGSIQAGTNAKKDVILDCKVAILGNSEEDVLYRVCLANTWLAKRGKLEFWDQPGRYYIGEVVGEVSMESQITWNTFGLQFRCEPVKYGQEVTQVLDGSTLANRGTYKTKGVITLAVTADTNYIQARLVNTGEFVYIEHDFVAGDEVEISLERSFVKKNGYLINEDVYLESDYFFIPPGDFQITVEPAETTATITYIERWL